MRDSKSSGKKPIKEVQELRARKPKLERVSSDITERKKAEDTLPKSEQEYKTLFESTKDGIIRTDMQGKILDANKAYLDMLGYSMEEIRKLRYQQITPEKWHQMEAEIVKNQFIKRGYSDEYEKEYIKKDGTIFPISLKGWLVKDEQRQPVGMWGFVRDITERKKAEEELRQSKEFLVDMIDALDDPVFVKDEQHRWVILNDAACKVMGRSREELIGKSDYDLFSKQQADVFWQRDELVLKNGRTDVNEEEITWHGKLHTISTKKSLFTDSVTGKKFIVGTIRDITERKKAEEEIRKFKTICDRAGYGVAMSDVEGNLIYVNRSFAQMHGYTADELIGKNLSLFHNQEQMKNVNRLNDKLRREGSFIAEEVWHKREDDTVFPTLMHGTLIRDEKRKPLFMAATAVDITERKRMEEALRRSKTDWENTFNAISDWVVLMDLKGRILRTNRAGEEFVGVPMAEIPGQTCCKLLHGSDTPLPGCPLLKMLRTGRSENMELQLPDSNRWMETSVDPVIDEKGTLIGAVHIARDITERRHAEDERESTIGLLHLLNATNQLHDMMKLTMVFLKDWSNCEAVGIRLQEGEDFPYFETSGFSEDFILAENKLCSVDEAGEIERDSQSRPYLECMCGNVISGRFDPSKYFFTEHGSFWVNSTTELLAGTTNTDRMARTRNRCNTAGYESVALVPLCVGGETFGLLQFNDKQRGRFTPEKISLFERLADNLAIGLAQRRAEEALSASEEQYRAIFEQAADAIVLVDAETGELLEFNDRTHENLGYTREEFRKLKIPDLEVIESAEEVAKHIEKIITEGADTFETKHRTKGGEIRDVQVSSRAISIREKDFIQSIWCDITERKQAEQKLRESEERLKILFEYAPDGIYLNDLKGNFVDGNKAAEELVGFKREELIGKNLAEVGLLPAGETPKALANLEKVANGEPTGPDEFTLERKDGNSISVEIRTFPVRIKDQILSLGIARDITERKNVEQRLLQEQAKLKSLASELTLAEERERRRIATELHDRIGQSLVISKMNLEALRKSSYGQEFDRTLDEICNTLGQTIADTRTLTFDLSSPILYQLGFEMAVAEWLTEQIQDEHGIATQFEDDGRPKPLGDDIGVLLFRNVRELLINVVRHARAKKTKVSIRRVGKKIQVSVEDDGVGFDPAKAASTAAKRAEFGLFSIRQRLEELGGHLEIDSEPGLGCKVTMTAPLKQE